MKIAIVGPSPVPFAIGGVENVLWGLTSWINEKTIHQAELIKLPTKENSFWDLIESYNSFYKLDLSHFDMAITTKYPAWMIKHDNHICYLHHRLRGLYDTYHFTGLSTEIPTKSTKINNIIDLLAKGNLTIDDLFDLLYELKDSKIPDEFFLFPGPFIKCILTYLDNAALKNVKRNYCISQTVKRRTEYFPEKTIPQVLYPPPPLNNYSSNEYDYIFTISRLDNPKRVDLLIKAMAYVTSPAKLIIAGTGPEEKHLKEMAKTDQRIEFIGFVNNDELINYYSNALVVLFVPYEEDYGLITIEAFKSKKPVITCMDSGGSNEFVKDFVTGFSVPPDPQAIAQKIDYFSQHKEEAIKMGERGYESVKNITWENVANNLLNTYIGTNITQKQRILITSTFPIYPPQGGGQSRIYNLYKNMTDHYDIDILSFTGNDQPAFNAEISPGFKEFRFPKTAIHQQKEWEIEKNVGVPITDVAMPLLSKYTSQYGDLLRQKAKTADIIIISHPYLYYELGNTASRNYKLVYEAQDVEFDLKSRVLPTSANNLLKEIYNIEKRCCIDSDLIMTCSQEDATRLADLYKVDSDKFVIVPNGVDINRTPFTPWDKRKIRKKELGLEQEFLVLFMGSWHPPNLEACNEIFSLAKKLPDVKFLLLGSQCQAFQSDNIPNNVGLMGVVEDSEKNIILGIVDLALNPMISGSGTNLKMFDYMSAGIPVITTNFGARGIERRDIFIISELPEMAASLNEKKSYDFSDITAEARHYVERTFDWNIIAEILIKKLNTIFSK